MPAKPIQLPTGAPAVLDTAAKWEAEARADVDRLSSELRDLETKRREANPADDGREWSKEFGMLEGLLANSEKRWKMRADMVHKLDRSVEPAKRNAEESITRQEGAEIFTIATITMRTAVERIKETIVPRIRESATNEQGFAIVDSTFSEEFRNAMRTAVSNGLLPEWLASAVENAL